MFACVCVLRLLVGAWWTTSRSLLTICMTYADLHSCATGEYHHSQSDLECIVRHTARSSYRKFPSGLCTCKSLNTSVWWDQSCQWLVHVISQLLVDIWALKSNEQCYCLFLHWTAPESACPPQCIGSAHDVTCIKNIMKSETHNFMTILFTIRCHKTSCPLSKSKKNNI